MFGSALLMLVTGAGISTDVDNLTFVVTIPPGFERDMLKGLRPTVQLAIDATAMMQAGIGAQYIQQIFTEEAAKHLRRDEGQFLSRSQGLPRTPVTLSVRIAFNPNVTTSWFTGIMAIINNVTMLGIIMTGAAVVREREHGTMDHLLAMPLTPFEIAAAKIWANGLIITIAVGLSLAIVVQRLLAVPIAGSVPLFMAGVVLYLLFSTAIGIFLATVARTMPQLGLLYLLVAVPMNLLSGSNTPVESMPAPLRVIMSLSPSTHFVAYAQAILYRGADFWIVWLRFLLVGAMGLGFFWLAILRFRRSAAMQAG